MLTLVSDWRKVKAMMTSMTLIRLSLPSKSQVTHLSKIVQKNSFEQSRTLLGQLPLEILRKLLIRVLFLSDFKFSTRVCWTFNDKLKTIRLFKVFKSIGTNHFSRVRINNNDYLSIAKASGEITVNLHRKTKSYGSSSGIVFELD